MKEANIGSFVLIEAGGEKIVIGADAIKPVRIITAHPDSIPEELLLEDGSRVKVVFLKTTETIVTPSKPAVEQVQAEQAAPAIDTSRLAEIKQLLESALPAWPKDLPPEENLLDQLAITDKISQLKDLAERLEKEYKEAFDKVSERWSLLLQQISVVKRNYAKALEERERVVRNLSDLE